MDALEGYEVSGKDQQAQLDEITQRIKKRVIGSEKRIVPWRYFAIAASILAVFTIGGLLLFNKKLASPEIALVIKHVAQRPADTFAIKAKENNEIADTQPPQKKERPKKVNHVNTSVFKKEKDASVFAKPMAQWRMLR